MPHRIRPIKTENNEQVNLFPSITAEPKGRNIIINFEENISGTIGLIRLSITHVRGIDITYPNEMLNESTINILASEDLIPFNRYTISITSFDVPVENRLKVDSSGSTLLPIFRSVSFPIVKRYLLLNSVNQNRKPPDFTINGVPYDTRKIDLNIEEMIESPIVNNFAVVSFENLSDEFEIRYTTNSNIPKNKSTLYTGPITIQNNVPGSDLTVLRARIYSKTNSSTKTRILKLKFKIV